MSNHDIAKPFTVNELQRLIRGKCEVITPQNRIKILGLTVGLGNGNIKKALIFYETGYDLRNKTRTGHWCCMASRDKDVYFFDSIGLFPDDQLEHIPDHLRITTNQSERTIGQILRILMKKGFKIHYNDKKLQENVSTVNTCGRYCCLFLNEAVEMGGNPYINMINILENYKGDEKYYDQAIVKYGKY